MNIETLATKWNEAADAIFAESKYDISCVEELLRETYRLCTQYKDADAVPKAFCKIFVDIDRFVSGLVGACHIDELTTPSDGAEYGAITYIIDEIVYGFYEGNYESAFPYLCVDNNENKAYALNLEEAFLEAFIDENR